MVQRKTNQALLPALMAKGESTSVVFHQAGEAVVECLLYTPGPSQNPHAKRGRGYIYIYIYEIPTLFRGGTSGKCKLHFLTIPP